MRALFRWVFRILELFALFSAAGVILFRYFPVPITPFILCKISSQVFSGDGLHFSKDWVALEDMSEEVPLAMMAAEDQHFLTHNGFDIKAIKKAFENNRSGGKVKGGSTISQQTAKNMFLWPGRSWLRKGLEAWFTILIELFWSKDRIMEVYVNVIEMGKGIYGIEAAAREYYGKSCAELTRGEAAMIACILPNPIRFSPLRPQKSIFKKHQRVQHGMAYLKAIREKKIKVD